ncbi:hypothetical protein ABT297_37860 [Dactylosporangium sp. NPDC000555]|uniref:hypothetical protein n=1 Tax=Dactylosporangium sp. NPDC000555 TaxID=3154260 RepID=UPI00331A84C6
MICHRPIAWIDEPALAECERLVKARGSHRVMAPSTTNSHAKKWSIASPAEGGRTA